MPSSNATIDNTVSHTAPIITRSFALSGNSYERACAIVSRCGSDPAMVERHGKFTVHCPAHNDRKPSLRITATGDKVLLHCWTGCTVEAICSAIGLTLADLFSDDQAPRYSTPRKKPKALPPDNVPLQFAVSFLIEDPSMLEVEGLQDVLRAAYANAPERLWVERELARHGMTASVVWAAIRAVTSETKSPKVITAFRKAV